MMIRGINMGCDIHCYMEIKINGKYYYAGTMTRFRNYFIFSMLSGVRSEGDDEEAYFPTDCDMPEDCCDEIKIAYERWGEDAHTLTIISNAHLVLDNFIKERLQQDDAHFVENWNKACKGVSSCLGFETVRLVMWYDN